MSEENMEDIIKKISCALNKEPSNESSSDDFSEKIKNVISNFNLNSDSSNTSSNSDTSNNSNTSTTDFNFDINTIFKLKSAFDKMNLKEEPRNNLLIALKPYLRTEKKEKLDKYMQFMNVAKIMNLYNSTENR